MSLTPPELPPALFPTIENIEQRLKGHDTKISTLEHNQLDHAQRLWRAEERQDNLAQRQSEFFGEMRSSQAHIQEQLRFVREEQIAEHARKGERKDLVKAFTEQRQESANWIRWIPTLIASAIAIAVYFKSP